MKIKINTIISSVLKAIFVLYKNKLPQFNNEDAEYIIWAPNYFTLRYIINDNFIRVHSTYSTLKAKDKRVTIYTKDDIGKFSHKKIFLYPDVLINKFSLMQYNKQLELLAEQLSIQNNLTFPDLRELKFWENKLFMHQEFHELKINTPQTVIHSLLDFPSIQKLEYPILVKEPNSCSANGVHKVESYIDFIKLYDEKRLFERNHKIIFQKQLEIRQDLRVIFIGTEIVWFYWRKNYEKNWKPTSTGSGGGIDFSSFPERWRDWIMLNIKKLKISNGAFDIAWENDDLSTEPFILEVSPFYQPNPKCNLERNLKKYGAWKKSISFVDNYQIEFVKLVSDIQKKVTQEHLLSHDSI